MESGIRAGWQAQQKACCIVRWFAAAMIAAASFGVNIQPASASAKHHTEGIESYQDVAVAFNPDGRLLAVPRWMQAASRERSSSKIRILEADTWREVRTLAGHEDAGITDLLFSSDGELLASGGGGAEVKLWEVATGHEVRTLQSPDACDWFAPRAFSPDRRWLLTMNNYGVSNLWDLATGREHRLLADSAQFLYPAIFSPDGRSLVTGSSGEGITIRVWDVATAREIRRFDTGRDYREQIYVAALSPDARLLATGHRHGQVRLWSVDTGRLVRTLS